jgi:hypothetical protein
MLSKSQTVRTEAGHRSLGEDLGVAQLLEHGIEHHYEKIKIPYVVPESQHYYLTDVAVGRLEAVSKATLSKTKTAPKSVKINDIVIGSITFFLEFKGYPFTAADRKKYILVREQNPKIDLRFVFSDVKRKIGKNSKTTCGDWAEKHGFKYAHKSIPDKWLEEARV